MKAVILAAGQCSRMRPISLAPKCLLPAGEQTLLDHQIQSLTRTGIDEIAVVVGYRANDIVRHVRDHHAGVNVTFIENPAYRQTNNIYSLRLSERWLASSKFICLNADVLFHPAILPAAIETTAPISMIVDPEFREETMKVIIRNGRVVDMRKGIPRHCFSGTYLGVTTFSSGISRWFFATVSELVGSGRHKEFFNVAVQELVDDGVEVSYTSTDGLPWAEIDDPSDYRFAQEVVVPQLVGEAWPAAQTYQIREATV